MLILGCMGSKICVKFQRAPLKFHTIFLTHTPQNMHFTGSYFCVWFTISLNCVVISSVGEFPTQRPVTLNFDVFFVPEQTSKQSRRRWFETPSRSLWRHCKEQQRYVLPWNEIFVSLTKLRAAPEVVIMTTLKLAACRELAVDYNTLP